MRLDPERITDALELYATGLRTGDPRTRRLATRIERCHHEMADEPAARRLGLAQSFIADLRLASERYAPAELVEPLVEAHGTGEPGDSVPLSTFETLLDTLRAFATVERTSLGSPSARRLRASISPAELDYVRERWDENDPQRRPNASRQQPNTPVRRIAETISGFYDSTTKEPDTGSGVEGRPPVGELTVREVEELAIRAHDGQQEMHGAPYHEHLRTVAGAVEQFGPDLEMAGWLHDILEITAWTADELREAGVPDRVVEIVEWVTPDPGSAYLDSIRRTAQHPEATLVKIADNADSIYPERAAVIPNADELRANFALVPPILWPATTPENVTKIVGLINPPLLVTFRLLLTGTG